MGCELEPAESLRTCLVRNESTRETQFLRHSPPSTPGVLGPPASLVEQVSGGRVSECTVIAKGGAVRSHIRVGLRRLERPGGRCAMPMAGAAGTLFSC